MAIILDDFDIGPQSDEFEYPYEDLDGHGPDICLPYPEEDSHHFRPISL